MITQNIVNGNFIVCNMLYFVISMLEVLVLKMTANTLGTD